MADILNEVVNKLPKDTEITSSNFEGANIILYTKNTDFFNDNKGEIKKLVSEFKKRIELRPDPSLCKDMENTESFIRKTLPEESNIDQIIFDPQRSIVIIEAENPAAAIGKTGELLKEIKEKTLWVPLIRRKPSIRSKIIENIRAVLYENNDYRKKFLNEVGKRIYNGWVKGRKEEWIRITTLGAGRQVGRACFLVQTPESRVLLDCGVNPASNEEEAYPYFDCPEFRIQELDAVIISHAHLDHCLPPDTPVLLKNGNILPIDNIKENDELISINFSNGKKVIGKCTKRINTYSHKEIYQIRTPYYSIEASPNHKFFTIKDLEVKEIKAEEISIGTIIPGTMGIIPKTKNIALESTAYNERIYLSLDAKKELRKLRETKKLSQTKVSSYIGAGINFVNDLENKYTCCSKELLYNLLKFYKINPKKFFEINRIKKINLPKKLTPELAQIIGYLTGDGHISSDYSIRATDKDIECLKEYQKLVEKVFNYTPYLRHHSDKTKNANIIEINNAGIKRFIETNFKETFNKSKEKIIPKNIAYSSKAIITKFIRGLADAEGSVNQNITIASSSPAMLESLQFLLSSLKIPCTIDYKRIRVNISCQKGLINFEKQVGFSHAKKSAKLKELIKKSLNFPSPIEFFPISSEELDKILEKIRLKGKARGSIDISKLPLCIVDWRRRRNSYPTKNTLLELLKILRKRINQLKSAKKKNIRNKRIILSITLNELGRSIHYSVMQIQFRERLKTNKIDEIYHLTEDYLNKEIDNAIFEAESITKKIKTILNMPICWQKITKINKIKNPYPYLVDIEVDPTKNFIAKGIVVHNSAMVPLLVKYGYKGPIYCTEPTRDIMSLLALDFISIGFKDAKKPAFEVADVKQMVKQTICINMEEVTDITPDIRLTFYNSGHIIGGAMPHLHIGNGLHNILYTSDLLYETSNLLPKAITNYPRLETVIIESTYGGNNDAIASRKESEDLLMATIKKTVENGGKVLMPVLGVGRSQEIMLMIERAAREGTIPKIPIYLQGLVWDVNAIHTAYPEFFNSAVRKQIFFEGNNPFLSETFKKVGSQKEMEQVMHSAEPCVIMATSGMLTGGASLEYFKTLSENSKNTVILTCYQAEGSLGRRIQNGEKELSFSIGDNKSGITTVRAEILTIKGFSGHSSRPQLLSFLKNLDPKPKRVLIQHGENIKCLEFASTVHKMLHIETSVPRNLDSIRLV